ncbi:fatty acid desaturase [Labrys neptuniae]
MLDDKDIDALTQAPRSWNFILSRYREPATSRSVFEVLVTVIPFIGLWGLMWLALGIGYWLCLLLAIPTAGFLVRLFMIQHDCGHGAFFRRRATNDWIGRVIGVVTLTPYGFWRRAHATHHAAVGNLEHRGVGDIFTLTTTEYLALNPYSKLGYRLYRNPIVLFGFMPAYLFLLHQRLPFGFMRAGWQPWFSTMGTNAAIATLVVTMLWLVGIKSFLLVEGPVMLIAASIGVWFFYVQHQFEDTQWAHDGDWNVQEAALHGSSYYELPPPLAWFTGNIGVHHVHHLCSRVPFYRLPQVLIDHPALATVGRLTLVQSLHCAGLALWDENQGKLISFRELRRRRLSAATAALHRHNISL